MRYFSSGIILLCLLFSPQIKAQSPNFSLGKNLDIQANILKNLSSSYVDTINFDKMMAKGFEAMLSSLDPYTTFIAEEEEENLELMTTGIYGGVGSLIKKRVGGPVIITAPYAGSPAVKASLEPGDEILKIDGVSVLGMSADESSAKMKGEPASEVTFTVKKGRSGDTVDVVVVRERIHISNVEYSGLLQDSIGYIHISGFTDKTAEELKMHLKELKAQGAKRLVLDLRGNGGGLMDEAIEMISLFVPKGTMVVSSRGRDPHMNQEYFTTEAPVDTLIPLMVMVDSGSASSSEIVAGALQDLDRAVIAGKRSFGKGLIQSILTLPYGAKVKLTTGKYYTPSGRCVQAIDYSNRNEDGSVGHVPDSLRREFKTKNGRSVYDGGGIAPDIEVGTKPYSRPVVSLVYADILGDFAINYYKKHPQIAPASEFYLSDAEYEEFVEYASALDFDSRSAAETVLDQLVRAAKADNLYDEYKAEIEALSSKIKMEKAKMLRVKCSEIKPLLEQEIVSKYYFSAAGHIISLRDDSQLFEAIDKWQTNL